VTGPALAIVVFLAASPGEPVSTGDGASAPDEVLAREAASVRDEAAVRGEAASVHGRVVDSTGQGLADVEVQPSSTEGPLPTVRTGRDGAFEFAAGGRETGRLVVRAPGFAEAERSWSAASGPLVIVLEPARSETVTVTAGRSAAPLADTAARVVVLGREALADTPAAMIDDVLRQVPGFSLFRRSGSRVANPTAQGASMRGVGPSGASRTVVLFDGVPLNDPFGGWVYWSRIPTAALDRVEVVEGGASELYGSAALGGVVQALSRRGDRELAFEAWGGNESTGALSLYAATRRGDWSFRFAGDALTTDGYVLVADDQRGPIDTPAGASHLNGIATVERRLSSGASVFLRGALFGESRENGTPLQVNDTDLQELIAGTDARLAGGALAVRGSYGTETYHQSFTAVGAGRASETLTRLQRVPSWWATGSATWSRAFASGHGIVAGVEGRHVDGRSDETAFVQGRPTNALSAGGEQGSWAVFADGRLALGSRSLVTVGARLDHWTESDGYTRTQPLSGATPSETRFDDRQATALSPRASWLFRASPRVQLYAAGYGAFRGPTLNELYRSFRVGDTLTLANPALEEERLAGGEAGATWTSPGEGVRLRAVAFAARLSDPVANVTLTTTPVLITRQRQNLGRTRSRGLELDGSVRLRGGFAAGFGYAFTDATVRAFAADESLVGNDVPQVARHQGTVQLRYAEPRIADVSLYARVSSGQFEDDQNRLRLGGFFSLDLRVARRVGHGLELFAAAENLTGERYDVGLTPVRTLGPPVLLRAGIALR
jgi:outer membrane receptor protein involved in Fe transport